jgi:hypothetical protein
MDMHLSGEVTRNYKNEYSKLKVASTRLGAFPLEFFTADTNVPVHTCAGILLGLVVSCITLSFSQTLTTKVIRLRCDGRTIQVFSFPLLPFPFPLLPFPFPLLASPIFS